MNPPDITVIIPVYNRGRLIRHTLQSVHAASAGLTVEILIVDDGSTPPLDPADYPTERILRQDNRGLLFARLTGFAAATGRHVLFLDSDDLISADKLRAHVRALDAGADVAYSDSAHQLLDDEQGPLGSPERDEPLAVTTDAAVFFITVQPAPHSPAFRTDYLRARIAAAPFPPSPLYNPVAEIWFYHICAPFHARVVKCEGLAIVGTHTGQRLTSHWERIGVASLAVQEGFARSCPTTPEAHAAQGYFATKAFGAWRRLPVDFSPEFSRRVLALYTTSPVRPPLRVLGGRFFRLLAGFVGPVLAGRIFRRWQSGSYAAVRTLDADAFNRMLGQLPPP